MTAAARLLFPEPLDPSTPELRLPVDGDELVGTSIGANRKQGSLLVPKMSSIRPAARPKLPVEVTLGIEIDRTGSSAAFQAGIAADTEWFGARDSRVRLDNVVDHQAVDEGLLRVKIGRTARVGIQFDWPTDQQGIRRRAAAKCRVSRRQQFADSSRIGIGHRQFVHGSRLQNRGNVASQVGVGLGVREGFLRRSGVGQRDRVIRGCQCQYFQISAKGPSSLEEFDAQ